MKASSSSNALILRQAASHLVEAYRILIQEYESILPLALHVDSNAPETYEGLCANMRNGSLSVTEAFSETSIYGKSGNVTFRIFHDYGHLLYARKFTTSEEIDLAQLQWSDIKPCIPAEWLPLCHVVYFADTVEQSRFESLHGAFPSDQRAFVQSFLNQYLANWSHA